MMGWWRRQPLRTRLAIWYAVGGAALFSVFGMVVYHYVASRLGRPLDYTLRKDEMKVRRMIAVGKDRSVSWKGQPLTPDTVWSADDPWFELWDEKGSLICRYWALDEDQLKNLPVAPARRRETISVFRVSDDIRLRALSVPFKNSEIHPDWMLRVMRLHRRSQDALGSLLVILAISLPVIIVLLVLGGYKLTLHWLKPLEAVVEETEKIKADKPGFRLSVANEHDEIGRLATAFNRTLDRLEQSYLALEMFAADASHELRTPLSALRTVGEVALSSDRNAEEYRDVIGSMLEEAQRLRRLVERLLELSRAEGGGEIVHLSLEDIDGLVRDCASEMLLLAEEKSQVLTVATVPCKATVDRDLFLQALRNLIENAIKHTPEKSAIDVRVAPGAAGSVDVAVMDNGPGIPSEHRLRVMDRFFRSDGARGKSRSGFGLGLAISRAYVRAMGGDLKYEPVEPTGCLFTLKLGTKRRELS